MLDKVIFSVGGILVTKLHLVLLTSGLFLWTVWRYISARKAQIVDNQNGGESDGKTMASSKDFSKANAEYLASKLKVTSTFWDILFFIATTPENITTTTNVLKKIEEIKEKKLRKMKEREEAKKENMNALMEFDDDGGWATDDDDDEDEDAKAAAIAAKKHDEEMKKQERMLKRTMGTVDPTDTKLEGVDEGTIGQQWVMERLRENKVWPPRIPTNVGTFEDASSGKKVHPSEHPAVVRNLIMTLGRLNAMILNSHPDLAKADGLGNVDQTYFRSVHEFRQRTGLLLEVCLRIACAARSYRLVKTIVETVAMFKIGVNATNPKVLAWFRKTMEKQYGGPDGVPRLVTKGVSLVTPGEKEIVTGENCMMSLDFERVHAEPFLRNKLEMCKKQGIPPQIGLQSFREVWWVLIRSMRTDGDDDNGKENVIDPIPSPGSIPALASEIAKSEDPQYRLIHAHPFIVAQINKKEFTIKAQLKAPSTSGTYTFYASVLSQEFLGCNMDIEIKDIEIKDSNLFIREKKSVESESVTDELKKEK